MAVQTVDQLKQWFQTRDKPTQQQFWDWLDSFVHKNEGIGWDNIAGLVEILQGKVDTATLELYALKSQIMLLVDEVTGLIALSRRDAAFVLLRDYAILAPLHTSELPNDDTTFPSSEEGWLWQVVIRQGAGSETGMLADRFTIAADHTYTLDIGFSIDKIKIKPVGAETIRAGLTEGGQEVIIEQTIPGGQWHTTSIDIDAESDPVDIFFTGVTGNVDVIIYKRQL